MRIGLLGTLVVAMVLISGCGFLTEPAPGDLNDITNAIQDALDDLDTKLAAAADSIADTGLDSAATRTSLEALCADETGAVDCSTVSLQGILTAVEPEEYQDAEGADISDQEQVIRLQQTKQPVVSELFTAVEGFAAIDIEYPLLDDANQLQGSVSILIKQAEWLGAVIEPMIAGTDYLCMVVQEDGVILYDVDPEQVGKDTFNDAMYQDYPELLKFAEQYLSTPQGVGQYSYKASDSDETVTKRARWMTVTRYGTDWRVLLISELD